MTVYRGKTVSVPAHDPRDDRLHDLDHRESTADWRLFGDTLLTMITKAASGYWKTIDPQNGYTPLGLTGPDAAASAEVHG